MRYPTLMIVMSLRFAVVVSPRKTLPGADRRKMLPTPGPGSLAARFISSGDLTRWGRFLRSESKTRGSHTYFSRALKDFLKCMVWTSVRRSLG